MREGNANKDVPYLDELVAWGRARAGDEDGLAICAEDAIAVTGKRTRSVSGTVSKSNGIGEKKEGSVPGAVGVDAGLDAELGNKVGVDVPARKRGGGDGDGDGDGGEDCGGELHC